MTSDGDGNASDLSVVLEQLDEAIAARKCHPCGCFQHTVEALSSVPSAHEPKLAGKLAQARSAFKPRRYECLGCTVCFPAVAANAFSEAVPDAGAALDLCPTEEPQNRGGWPPLLGDYTVLRARAPVAVCTLNSLALAEQLVDHAPEGMAMVGTLCTENLGIERLLKNIISNADIRFLVLCGQDTRQRVGHLPGQSLQSLCENGVDAHGRIRGARGKRPVLRNISTQEIEAFREQVELVSRIGEEDQAVIAGDIERLRLRDPGPVVAPGTVSTEQTVQATEPQKLVLDKAGYLVIYPDAREGRLIVEHYSNAGVLDCVLEGRTPAALYGTAIERGLVTRLDHAAYLGTELARAEENLLSGKRYVQDRAPGRTRRASGNSKVACGCGSAGECP